MEGFRFLVTLFLATHYAARTQQPNTLEGVGNKSNKYNEDFAALPRES